MLPRAGDRVTALVKEFFDAQDRFDVLFLIYALSGFGFFRSEIGKFGFPESKDKRLDVDNLADLADPEKQFIWDLR